MPTRNCDICNRLQKYSKDDYKYLDKDGPLVCSIDCIKDWIYLYEVDHPMCIRAGVGRWIVQLSGEDRPHNAYSQRMKQWYASQFEMIVHEVLDGFAHPFDYEPFCFQWGSKSYTPDLMHRVRDRFCFLEGKGEWQASQRSKYK